MITVEPLTRAMITVERHAVDTPWSVDTVITAQDLRGAKRRDTPWFRCTEILVFAGVRPR
jgi:hypothetical protein